MTTPVAPANRLGFLPDDWNLVHTFELAERDGTTRTVEDLKLHPIVEKYLVGRFPNGIYQHQHSAIQGILVGSDVCLATSTASGKTLAFMTAALHRMSMNTSASILAIYPQRALGVEQEARWRRAVSEARVDVEVCRIDGSVAVASRATMLGRSRIAIVTPDIVHAWMLSNGTQPALRRFLGNLSLLIVDEVHTYTGVVGSNAAFLFRRLLHAAEIRGAQPQIFAASATIGEPSRHLQNLFGRAFQVIGPDEDTSPRNPVSIHMATPPRQSDFLTETADFLKFLAQNSDRRFIAFVDSRKQTEHIASILCRADRAPDTDGADEEDSTGYNPLESADFLPYRSGYEEADRERIQRRLSEGSLRGVVSTSALELGLDIPHLNTAVLVGVPRSSTNLQQRIGRIGRTGPGEVVVINAGEVYDEAVFRRPDQLLSRPPAESALYLENPRIQYIQALCLARLGGEHDQFLGTDSRDVEFTSPVNWPDGFLELCRRERAGQIAPEFQALKAESGDAPNYVFPLRDVEPQFDIEQVHGPNRTRLGSISHSQLLREAYPGAIYYYATQPYRVTSVSLSSRKVSVRREKRYTTRPTKLPTMVFPNLTEGNVHQGTAWQDLRVVECNLQIREALSGFRERRGGRETTVSYPLGPSTPGLSFNGPRFVRLYFTTGVLLAHPLLEAKDVDGDIAAAFVYEALLMTAPFERQDVGFAIDRVRTAGDVLPEGRSFLAIFDQTYGSLRLSRRLADPDVLRAVLARAVELAENDDAGIVAPRTLEALRVMLADFIGTSAPATVLPGQGVRVVDEERIRVILPGSHGINVTRGNAEFIVEKVLFVPRLNSLAYRGRHASAMPVEGQTESIPVSALVEIPGESKMGIYDLETGEVTPEQPLVL